MVAAAVGDEEGVAPELEAVSAELPRDLEEAGEHQVQGVGQLLGAHLAATGQALGEGREAGDVGEHERAVERLPARFGWLVQPLPVELGHVGAEAETVVHGRVDPRARTRRGHSTPALPWLPRYGGLPANFAV